MNTMLISGMNIILDPILIFDTIPILIFQTEYGDKRAALATVLAQATTVVCLITFYKGKTIIRLKIKNLILEAKLIMEVISIGFSSLLIGGG